MALCHQAGTGPPHARTAGGARTARRLGDGRYGLRRQRTVAPLAQERRQPYVLALASNDEVDLPWGRTSYHVLDPGDRVACRDRAVLAADERRCGSQGTTTLRLGVRATGAACRQSGFEQALLIRRPLDAPEDPKELVKELAYYLTFAPAGTLLGDAGGGGRAALDHRGELRGRQGRGRLDQYEVRRYPSWYRHITLAMLALAYLAVVRSRLAGAAQAAAARPQRGASMAEFLLEHGELIPLTLPEVRRLVYRVVVRILAPPETVLHWSHWRRRHQARAQRSHYHRRLARHLLL